MSVFKRRRFPAEIILLCVRWYCRYGISYRDLEEMMAERGVAVDHVTLYRWIQRYAPELEKRVRWYQGYRSSSWRVDETYVRVGGKWKYLFRAVDKQGRLIDFMLSDRRNTKAARRFLAKALKVMRNWPPVSVTTDKLGSYPKALRRLKRKGELKDTVRHRTSKYLNNRIEADHGALKRLIRPTRGLPVDEDRLCHDQGLRDHAHDPTPPLHPDRTRGHRRGPIRQQTLRSRRLICAAEHGRFYPTAVSATEPLWDGSAA
jgi:transposase-like protein